MTCCDCPDVIHTPTFVVAEHQQGDMCTCAPEIHRVIVWALLTLSCHPQYLSVYESELSCDPQDFAEALMLVHG